MGITIDNKLTFKSHLKNICEKANQKLNALARITKFTSPFQMKTLLNSFIKSQFSYCPLIWMFISKGLNKKIFLNGYSPIPWMTFSIWDRILTTSETFMLLLLMCLEIIACSTPFIEQINYGKPIAFWLEKLMLTRIIQKRIKKLALH